MKPSIQTEIEKLQQTKEENRIAIMEKGVTVYGNDLYSSYPTRISQITMTPGDKDDIIGALIDRSVTSFEIPNGTTLIGFYAFNGCSSLTSVTIPDSVTNIGGGAFRGCTSLTNINIPDSVTNIGNYAFQSCSSLKSVTIPDSVTSIGYGAFRNCSSLASITVNATTPPTLSGGEFYNTNDCPIFVEEDRVDVYKAAWPQYADRIQAILVPTALKWTSSDGTHEISIACEDLDEAGTLTQDDRRIADTGGLMGFVEGSAEIGDCVTTIGQEAFGNCSSLTSIDIPDSVTTIGYSAFENCFSLANVTIPDSVTSIGSSAFQSCLSLSSITVNATTPPTLGGEYAFDNTNDCPIYVPSGSLETYLANSSWAVYKDRLFERGVAKWTEQSFECDVDETGAKTGMATVVEKDTNPSSSTYGQTRTETVQDEETCPTPVVTSFTKITSLGEATSGKYLIVDTSVKKALNASLIKDTTTSTNGINAFGNHISVDITDDTIEATEATLNAAVDYVDGEQVLSWTDENSHIYYLSHNDTGSSFDTSTSYPQGFVTPYVNTKGGITFKAATSNSAIALFTSTSGSHKFRWQRTNTGSNFNNVALFKLNQ